MESINKNVFSSNHINRDPSKTMDLKQNALNRKRMLDRPVQHYSKERERNPTLPCWIGRSNIGVKLKSVNQTAEEKDNWYAETYRFFFSVYVKRYVTCDSFNCLFFWNSYYCSNIFFMMNTSERQGNPEVVNIFTCYIRTYVWYPKHFENNSFPIMIKLLLLLIVTSICLNFPYEETSNS